MTVSQLAAIFLILVALTGWLNARFLNWPTATVMVIAGGLNAGLLVALAHWFPDSGARPLIAAVARLDFPRTVLGYMLAFLLFAGASQVDLTELRRRRLSIWSLATVGLVVSTIVVGVGLWLIAMALHLPLGLPWALVFGALISPTDPIAVLAAVRGGKLSRTLEVVLQGEALFNDGVGIVVFTALVAVASKSAEVAPAITVGLIFLQALGGLALGAAGGFIVIRAIRAIDDAGVEVIMSLALATTLFVVAQKLGVSGPIAVVAGGLLIGSEHAQSAMSKKSVRYLKTFWILVDEILNAALFLLLGLEILVVPFDGRLLGLGAAAVVVVLATRAAVVLPWGAFFEAREKERGARVVLAWGGLHGALSLALALSLSPGPSQIIVLSTTFAVVAFSVVVQGLSFARVVAWSVKTPVSPSN